VLSISDLSVEFRSDEGFLRAVDGVSLSLSPGRKLGIVGESGCGKSTLSLAVMRLLEPGQIVGGEIRFGDENLLAASEARLRQMRGATMSMIFQDASSALHPMLPVGVQIAETLQAHQPVSRAEARRRAVELLEAVGVPAAAERASAYPHELSGGMCQRVMIASAVACGPRLIIADEPTTALDVTVQAQILELLDGICRQSGASVLLITHDLGVVAGFADEVAVMYAGRIVEWSETDALFARPAHPYTKGLLASVPQMDVGLGRDLPTIPGSVGLSRHVQGCKFAPRCALAQELCWNEPPPLDPVEENHRSACWFSAAVMAQARNAGAGPG
jgi:oligopeptide/dipeptide ABC transporter ATP-binding protein